MFPFYTSRIILLAVPGQKDIHTSNCAREDVVETYLPEMSLFISDAWIYSYPHIAGN
jgi:hypothetical protein